MVNSMPHTTTQNEPHWQVSKDNADRTHITSLFGYTFIFDNPSDVVDFAIAIVSSESVVTKHERLKIDMGGDVVELVDGDRWINPDFGKGVPIGSWRELLQVLLLTIQNERPNERL